MEIIKEIRLIVNFTTVPTGTMIDIITKEYRYELSGEFSLWGLLRRIGEQFLNEKKIIM